MKEMSKMTIKQYSLKKEEFTRANSFFDGRIMKWICLRLRVKDDSKEQTDEEKAIKQMMQMF
jgi:hypothetical protein